MKKCVFAGSFDPITNGHMHIISRCAMMFEEVIVAIGINAQKKYMFTKEKRLEMVKLACARYKNVKVMSFDNMLGDFMREVDCNYLVRGVRNQTDIDYEEKCFKVTSSINPDVNLMFFNAPKEFVNLSSTFIKEQLKKGNSIKKYVPDEIVDLLNNK